jgi:hypothetical protein
MSDEQFMRVQNPGHSRFSADLHRHLNRRGRRQSLGPVSANAIGKTYENGAQGALLRGFAASVVTTALFLGGIFVLTAPPLAPAALWPAAVVDGAAPADRVELA